MFLLIPLRLVRGKKISEITNISYCEFSHRLNPLELLKNQKISALVKIYLKHTINTFARAVLLCGWFGSRG